MTARRAVIALGSNLPPREAHLDSAVDFLQRAGAVVMGQTPRWSTSPLQAPPQPDFLNQLLLLVAPLDGEGWLKLAKAAEARADRVRSLPRGPRQLDVDVILVEGEVRDGPRLTLPHPGLRDRPYLLRGSWLLVPDWELPGWGTDVSRLAAGRLRGAWAIREGGGPPAPGSP